MPAGWSLRKRFGFSKGANAAWVHENGVYAVKLHSKAALVFLEKKVDIDIREYPIVTWKWKVQNILSGIDERIRKGDDHPIRIFFVFDPDTSRQSLWFRLKRFLYLDRMHGHPVGGRFTEYLWSSHLQPGDIIEDPWGSGQKLIVIEGGKEKLGQWLSYRRNLYENFRMLYGEEPRRLVRIGILNDTDQSGLEAVSYIVNLVFHKESPPMFIPRLRDAQP
ncbi:MAG: DUF3047 domain-containing protein [Nitrospirae bacterium]|nr:DUF3047 domain-containing protein [Nitrospirota bacterium]